MALAVVVAGIIVGVAIAIPVFIARHNGSSSNSGGGSTSSQALSDYRQAMAMMRTATGFHYVASISGSGGQQTTGDATRDGGKQEISVASAYGNEHFTLLLVSGTVYFQGNAAALQDQLGVPASKAGGLSNQWISVVHGDGPYATLEVGINTSDQAEETALQPTSVSNVTESDGTSALRLEGAVPPQNGAPAGTGHLDIATSNHRPLVYYTSLSQQGLTLTSNVTFSSWGTAAPVSAPSGATAWTTLGASAPPGGYGGGGGGNGASPTPQGAI
ncbi:MAG: hypothetical protein JOZ75_05875 [Candidatus Dormibacteraeota bacterium]|nr:hypothetical protein [Candidatus Dormibacteraeota bacterium]